MEYWGLKENKGRSVGRYPQIDGWMAPYEPWGKEGIWGGALNYWGEIDPILKWPIFKIHPKSKLTDVIGGNAFKSGTALMCSDKALEVISAFDIPKHQIFKVNLFDKGIDLVYNFLYFSEINNDYIDYKKAEFFIKGNGDHPIEIKDAEDYFVKQKEVRDTTTTMIKMRKVELIDDIPKDLFRIYDAKMALIINNKMKRTLEKEISGVRFIPLVKIL